MPLDREKARAAIHLYGGWIDRAIEDDCLDALEECVTPRLAEVDVRLVSEAEAKLARIRKLAEAAEQEAQGWLRIHPEDEGVLHPYVRTDELGTILDARP